jgi:hypothetical protein
LSYPHINGLYLLLRESGLGISSGQGDNGRLAVSAKRLDKWSALNPQERYFTLLHAMVTGTWASIDAGSSRSGPWHEMQRHFMRQRGTRIGAANVGAPASQHFYSWTLQTTAALLELFGTLEIVRVAPHEGENWRITAVRRTAFGQALLGRLLDPEGGGYFKVCDLNDRQTDGKLRWLGDLFGDCFPDCRNTLLEAEYEFVDGLWEFKVSLGDAWRRIVIPADAVVDDLIDVILAAFKYDRDHLYEVTLRDRLGRVICIAHPDCDDSEFLTHEFAIGFLPLDLGQTMNLLYDFGDSWKFTIKLEKVLPANARITRPKVTAKHGKAPRQYASYDDCW